MKQQEAVGSFNATAVVQDVYNHHNTQSPFPDQCTLADLFFEQVKSVPQNIAIIEKDKQYTYLELGTEVNRLIRILRNKELEKGSAIVILLEPGFHLLATMLAVQKSGHYYIPIDIRSSGTHVHYMVSDCNPGLIMTSSTVSATYSFHHRIAVCLVDVPSISDSSSVNERDRIQVEDTAYVMYTSGTSGRPKRVAVSHRSLVNYCFWAMHEYRTEDRCVFPLITSVSFDLTITSLFVPLICGGSIVVTVGNEEETPVLTAIRENKVNIIKLTPSQLLLIANNAVSEQQYCNSSVRVFVVGGEDLSAKLCHKITALFGGNIKIYNEYGPTEATVGCMIYEFDPKNNTTGLIPVGKPISNSRIYLLDRLLMPVGEGEVGEIYIAGAGLAKEYMNNPKMNTERFIPDPFVKNEKMYKSGDLGRWNAFGELECLGRLERRVVIEGQIILLSEIENTVTNHESVLSSFAAIRSKDDGGSMLCVYVIPCEKGSGKDEIDRLKDELIPLTKEVLTVDIWTEIIVVDSFPLNLNDKMAADRL
ncbi:amino acid adenylation domain-containing protein [Chryseobacterium sp. MYb264]|uniref:amino acid adenylation domain-containing protein n=1 Tax=Chryseobacterium sp. MYb264 TaxID=2745153 RepID=UPI002E12E348|nr:amino acid adenylation domain-containing protein [Chryseobacterium sp. MYb264]